MRNLGINLFIGLAALALLLPFQNCSVYQSKDRETFDREGPAAISGGNLKPQLLDLGQAVQDDCHSMLNIDQVRSILGPATHLTLFVNQQTGARTCHISRAPTAHEPRLEYNCRLYQQASHLKEQLNQAEAVWLEADDLAQVARLAVQHQDFAVISFYGLSTHHPRASLCQISFVNASHLQPAQQMAQSLGRELAKHLSQPN